MKKKSKATILSEAFSDNLKISTIDCLSEIMETGIDTLIDNEIIKSFPIISIVSSLYNIGNSIREQYHLTKLAIFVNSFNQNIENDKKLKEYKNKFKNNANFQGNELKYIIVLIERQLEYEKPALLAKFYLHYLDNNCTWNDFCLYSGVIERLFNNDLESLKSLYLKEFITSKDDYNEDSLARLFSLGLIRLGTGLAHCEGVKYEYYVTELGKTFGKVAFN